MAYKVPHNFMAGEKAVALQFNENFDYLASSLNEIKNDNENEFITVRSEIQAVKAENDTSAIVRLGDITNYVSFTGKTIKVKKGITFNLALGKNEDGTNKYLRYSLPEDITSEEFTTPATGAVITLSENATLHEYSKYIISDTQPTDTGSIFWYNSSTNYALKRNSESDEFVQCMESVIATGLNRGEDGTITAINSIIKPTLPLSADRIHTANVRINATIELPLVEDKEKYINTMLECTIQAGCSLTLPSVKWAGGVAPELVANGSTTNKFIFDTTSGGKTWMCHFIKDMES